MTGQFGYHKASAVQEVKQHLQQGATLLAGGTDLVPLMKCEVRSVENFVGISGLEELRGIRKEEHSLRIGAMTTLTELENNPIVQHYFPAVSFAAKCVASPQIRNIGTLGGNIMQDRRCLFFNQSWGWRQSIVLCFKTGGQVCHQAPASKTCRAPYYSDVATALVACGAFAEVEDCQGRRQVTVKELCRSHSTINGTTDKEAVLVTAFILPLPEQHFWNCFIKEGVRKSIDFPIFNAAGAVTETNGFYRMNLTAGAIAPYPVELEETTALMERHQRNLKSEKSEIIATALEEIKNKSMLVRETAITLKTKRAAFAGIVRLIDELTDYVGRI